MTQGRHVKRRVFVPRLHLRQWIRAWLYAVLWHVRKPLNVLRAFLTGLPWLLLSWFIAGAAVWILTLDGGVQLRQGRVFSDRQLISSFVQTLFVAGLIAAAITGLSVAFLLLTLKRRQQLGVLITLEWCFIFVVTVFLLYRAPTYQVNSLLSSPATLGAELLMTGGVLALLNAMLIEYQTRRRLVAAVLGTVAYGAAVAWLLWG